jgi:hypothetical protein
VRKVPVNEDRCARLSVAAENHTRLTPHAEEAEVPIHEDDGARFPGESRGGSAGGSSPAHTKLERSFGRATRAAKMWTPRPTQAF